MLSLALSELHPVKVLFGNVVCLFLLFANSVPRSNRNQILVLIPQWGTGEPFGYSHNDGRITRAIGYLFVIWSQQLKLKIFHFLEIIALCVKWVLQCTLSGESCCKCDAPLALYFF